MTLFRVVSGVVWRLVPGRAATKLAEFSHTEAGSGLDMLAAAEETPRREMRARYFRHALDELRHARLFRDRALAMSGPRSRARAVLDDADWLVEHGIRGDTSLFQRLGETEFHAFVWVAETRGAEQFDVYARLLRDDAATAAMFATIAEDERFHIAYSRAALDRFAPDAGPAAVRRVRARRAWEAWLRFSHALGAAVAGAWLSVLYLALAPLALAARLSERPTEGFVAPPPRAPAPERARTMA